MALGEQVGEMRPALGVPRGRRGGGMPRFRVAGPGGDGHEQPSVGEAAPVKDLLGAAPGVRAGLEDRTVQLLVDAGDVGKPQPCLRAILGAAGLDPACQQEAAGTGPRLSGVA